MRLTSVIVLSSKEHNTTPIIDAFPFFHVIDTIPRIEMLMGIMTETRPDVLVVDKFKPENLNLIYNAIRSTSSKLLLIADQVDPDTLRQILRLGVQGILEGDVDPLSLYEALQCVVRSDVYIAPQTLKKVVELFKISHDSDLTHQETKILSLLMQGKTYSMIANELSISGNTVRAHMHNLYSKLEASNKAEAIQKAIELRIV